MLLSAEFIFYASFRPYYIIMQLFFVIQIERELWERVEIDVVDRVFLSRFIFYSLEFVLRLAMPSRFYFLDYFLIFSRILYPILAKICLFYLFCSYFIVFRFAPQIDIVFQ